MKTTDLLNLYKQEKSDQSGPTEDFPAWKEWKESYMADRAELFETVDAETAVAESDKIVEEAFKELDGDVPPVPVTKKEAPVVKTSKKDIAINIYKALMHEDEQGIFHHPKRKDVIAAFIADLGMSNAGASTYHYNTKKLVTAL